ncbi:MAG: LacI family DNA-binding transcriptional regulator [Verrucomicrobia bacterium]|nr:LacI family DNA-binding transcriptional regulator [Verrucomicrobiota bacterium]
MSQIQTVRMAEIAHSLGVASSTVSRALRGDPRISQITRERVLAIAENLGYRPNPLVTALMRTRRRRGGNGEIDRIALVTNYGGRESWRSKDVCRWEFEGVSQRAAALGYSIEVFALGQFSNQSDRLANALQARGIRGVLLGFSRVETEEVSFPTAGFCTAGLSNYFRSNIVDRANFHGFYNVQLALAEITRLGYRRPALAVPEFNNRVSNNLWSGAFLDWQRQLLPRNRCEPFIPVSADESGVEFNRWFEANQPDSLLVYKLPVHRFLADRSRKSPVGIAYLYRTAEEMGHFAGIDGNLSAVGAAAVDLVVERLNANLTGQTPHPKEVLIKGTWRHGASLPPTRRAETMRARARAEAPTPIPT